MTGRARVMTWNLWWRFGSRWRDRQHGVLQPLRGVDADVVALQEVWGAAGTTQAHELAGRLGLHAGFAAPSYPPPSDAPRSGEDEGVTWAWGCSPAARSLVDLATDPALDGPLPVVVAGDLNAAPDSPVLRPLREVMVDAWEAGGGDPAASTAPPDAGEELLDRRIDHVLLRPGQVRQRVVVESARLAGAPVDGLDPSDHRAVVCDLRWTAD